MEMILTLRAALMSTNAPNVLPICRFMIARPSNADLKSKTRQTQNGFHGKNTTVDVVLKLIQRGFGGEGIGSFANQIIWTKLLTARKFGHLLKLNSKQKIIGLEYWNMIIVSTL